MALNDSPIPTDRAAIMEDVLTHMTRWEPRERAGAFRKWLRTSLSLVHLHVLTVLESDGAMPMSKLAEAIDVSVASTTGIIDRMEERGLVERRREHDDRRVVLVHPTAGGAAVFRDLAAARAEHLRAALDGMTDEELRGFALGLRGLQRAREAAAQAAASPASGEPGS